MINETRLEINFWHFWKDWKTLTKWVFKIQITIVFHSCTRSSLFTYKKNNPSSKDLKVINITIYGQCLLMIRLFLEWQVSITNFLAYLNSLSILVFPKNFKIWNDCYWFSEWRYSDSMWYEIFKSGYSFCT